MAALVERGWLRPLGEDGAGAGESVITAELEGEDNAAAAMLQFRYSAAVNVAYNRLPFSFRGILHKCIGEWFEELYHCNPLHQLLPRLAWHWWKTAEYLSDSSSTSSATVASPASSASSASPHTPVTPKAGEQVNIPLPAIPTIEDPMAAAGKTMLIPAATSVTRQESDPIITTTVYHVQPTPIPSPTDQPTQPPLPHAATVLVSGSHAGPGAHGSGGHGQRQSLTAAPSASTVLHCRHRAIHWLRKAGEHAAKQGARREAIKFLGLAIQLIEQLPEKTTLRWRRRLLLVMTLYLPTYSVLVGVSKTLNEWSTLCSLCEELQLRTEVARRKEQQEAGAQAGSDDTNAASVLSPSSDDSAEMDEGADDSDDEDGNEETSATNIARATFYALRGYYLGLVTVNNGSVDLEEALRVSARMLKIAQNSSDWQMLTHALMLLAIQHNNTAMYEAGIVFCDQAWQLFLDNDSYPPYQVNTYAPMDASICSLICRAQARCVLGQLRACLDDTEVALYYAHRNGEPLTLMYAMNMHCYVLLQMDKRDPRVEHYWDHADAISTDTAGPTTLFEIEMALFSAYEYPDDLAAIQQAAERCWERYHNGPKWFIGFSGPMCHLLLLAGYWELGLHFIADWHLISIEGKLGHWYPECLRYEAMFLLQQAEAIIEEENNGGGGASGWRESSHGEGSDDEGEREGSFSYYSASERPTPLQRPYSDPLPLSDTSSSESRSDALSGREGSESSRSGSPIPSVDVWTLREEARQKLNAAIQVAEKQHARLLEMKSIMTLIPLLRFLQQVAPSATQLSSNGSPLLSSQSSMSASLVHSPLAGHSTLNSGHSSPAHSARRTSFSVNSPPPVHESLDERLHVRLLSQSEESAPTPTADSATAVLTSPGKLTSDKQLPSPQTLNALAATPHGADELAGVVSPASHDMASPYELECVAHEQRLRVLLAEMERTNEGMQFALFDEAREMLGLAAADGAQQAGDDTAQRRQPAWTEAQPRASGDTDAEARGELSKRMIAFGQAAIANGQAQWAERYQSM